MGKRRSTWFLLIVFGTAGCTDSKVLTRYADGNPRLIESTRVFGNSLVHEILDSIGRIEAIYEVKDSQLHGYYRKYHGNGKLASHQHYVHGRLEGYERVYHENGAKRTLGYFEDGLAEGKAMGWFDDGRVSDSAEYRNGLVQGLVTAYYDNGNLYDQCYYRNDTPIGLHVSFKYDGDTQYWALYDSLGNILEMKRFD